MSLDTFDEMALLEIAKRARRAHDNHQALEVSPHEYELLNRESLLFENTLKEAFRDALPHVASPMPWDAPGMATFGSLPVVVVNEKSNPDMTKKGESKC